ncbi:hypothetical protein, partial [Streptomyces sp. NPDC057496]|uniref:hypothetical protein n=1 Tax=Streptomyces sp. NPDC057496 TaxID=3346149 RepID=UPI0036CFD4B4
RPLLIGFLASLLGIGNLANKVKSVFHAVARPVNRAIDKIVDLITKKGKALWNKLKGKDKNREKNRPTQADQNGNKKPHSKNVIEKVKKAIDSKVRDGIPMDRAIDQFHEIRNQFRRNGLHGLRIMLTGGRFQVWASASPWQSIGSFKPSTTFTAEDLALTNSRHGADDYAQHTALIAHLAYNTSEAREVCRYKSGNGVHAEIKFLELIKGEWLQYVNSHPSRNKNTTAGDRGSQNFTFVARITRGPCSNCTTELIKTRQIIQEEALKVRPPVNVDIAVRAVGVYGGSDQWTSRSGTTYTNQRGDSAAGRAQIQRLLEEGISVGLLTLTDVTTQAAAAKLTQLQHDYIADPEEGKNKELKALIDGIKAGEITFP